MKQTLCQKCGAKQATVFYRENKNGVERQMHLCADCAKSMGIGDLQENLFSSFSLFSPHTEVKQGKACPLCGTTLSQIRRKGKFGCSSCYDTFAPLLDLTPFVGKGYGNELPVPEAKPEAPRKEKNELSDLKAQLKKAIAAEDYERAAVLRDEIRAKEAK